jgi:hypothetical protein
MAWRRNDRTMMILENEVVMIKIDGAKVRTVSRMRTWIALETLSGLAESSMPNWMVGRGIAQPSATNPVTSMAHAAVTIVIACLFVIMTPL